MSAQISNVVIRCSDCMDDRHFEDIDTVRQGIVRFCR